MPKRYTMFDVVCASLCVVFTLMLVSQVIISTAQQTPAVNTTLTGAAFGYSAPGIDGNTVANTTIFTNTSGSDFWVTEVYVILTTVSGLGTPPVLSVGKTASGYTDMVNAFALTALTSASTIISPTLVAGRVRLANGEALVARVGTAAIATTTYTFTVVVRGFYL